MRNPKFLVGGLLIVAAIVYLIVSSTQASAQYFLTIEELQGRKAEMKGQDLRISGAVLGDSISYDPQSLTLKFTVANIPSDNNVIEKNGGLAAVLYGGSQRPEGRPFKRGLQGCQTRPAERPGSGHHDG